MFFPTQNQPPRSCALEVRKINVRAMKRRSGQATLEFAFILPLFVALVLGVVQYGLLAQATEIATNLTRDGARFASIGATQTDDDIKKYVLGQANKTPLRRGTDTTDGAGNPKNDDISINITPTNTPAKNNRTKGGQVTVQITYNLRSRIFLPITGTLLSGFPRDANNDPQYVSTSIMRIVN